MNSIKEIEKEINQLENQKTGLDEKISALKKQKALLENSEMFLNIKTNEKNKELFAYYLMENKELSDRTVHNYFNALQIVKDMFLNILNIFIPTELYFVDDSKAFTKILTIFQNCNDMVNENMKRHYDLSAALNNYNNFLITLKEIK